jgi:AmmeMemoRadiSam system protein A
MEAACLLSFVPFVFFVDSSMEERVGGMEDQLTSEEKQTLLRLAREAMQQAVAGRTMPALNLESLTASLTADGASFITLTIDGDLRGCIGALEPYQPLAEDVREHAVAAALEDPRFPPVSREEVDRIRIEISRLTLPKSVEYTDAEDLLSRLRPHVDGVILRDGFRRATFLPQVWEKIPDKAEFLENLCYKMGAAPDVWRHKHLDVLTYKVEEFQE